MSSDTSKTAIPTQIAASKPTSTPNTAVATTSASTATTSASTATTNDNQPNAINETTASSNISSRPNSINDQERSNSPTSEIVLAYLKKRGLGTAALELTKHLKEEKKLKLATKQEVINIDDAETSKQEEVQMQVEQEEEKTEMELDDMKARDARTQLTLSTGGGIGYDLDCVSSVLTFSGDYTNQQEETEVHLEDKHGQPESRMWMESFIAFFMWVLSFKTPDDPNDDVQEYLPSEEDAKKYFETSKDKNEYWSELSQSILEQFQKNSETSSTTISSTTKQELHHLAFPLYVHIYCNLLEMGQEHDAICFYHAFQLFFQKHYSKPLQDMTLMATTKQMVELNTAISAYQDAQHDIRSIQNKIDTLKSSNSSSLETQLQNYQIKLTNQRDITKAQMQILKQYPFLNRVKYSKWQLTLNLHTFELIQEFLLQNKTSLEIILQQRMQIMISKSLNEHSFIPRSIVFDNEAMEEKPSNRINWAAPLHPNDRAASDGNDYADMGEYQPKKLPFPPLYPSSNDSASVEFNRALLIHGFRRLKALETKREYESGMISSQHVKADPLHPCIFLTTLCSSRTASICTPPDVHVTCAALSPADGRRIAVGCEDSIIRIMSVDQHDTKKEPLTLLIGHKQGLPLFDVSWCPDGRSLLSAGGDGSIRLWDTLAVGPFTAKTVKISKQSIKTTTVKQQPPTLPPPTNKDAKPTTHVNTKSLPSKNLVNVNAAQLATYKGHILNTPVYSVQMSPSGYYFLSTGADCTARLWSTDVPHKSLRVFLCKTPAFTGTWHPNCNYIFVGCADSLVRMFDVQSGKCVRILSGLSNAVSKIVACPSGKYVVATCFDSIEVCMWDLASGRLADKFSDNQSSNNNHNMMSDLYAMAYSACGTVLAAGGSDACVRVWDVKGGSFTKQKNRNDGIFQTKQTAILDLQFTKRNLLMGVGKYIG